MYIEKLVKDRKLRDIIKDVLGLLGSTEQEVRHYMDSGKLEKSENGVSFIYKTEFEEHSIYISDFFISSTRGAYNIDKKLGKYWYNFMSSNFSDYQEKYYQHEKQKIDAEYNKKIKNLEELIAYFENDKSIGEN